MLAFAAVLVAALSHMLAGGNTPTPRALVATTLVALPLAVLLAGHSYTLFRTLLAVSATQWLFHWIFVFVGVSSPKTLGADPMPAHAAQCGMGTEFVPILSTETGSTVAMGVAHVVAALVTVWMLRRGEKALMQLQRVLLRAIAPAVGGQTISPTPMRAQLRSVFFGAPNLSRLLTGSTITDRGPPQRTTSELYMTTTRDQLFANHFSA